MMKEGAWINSRTGQFAWITEHASWIQDRKNAESVGLNDVAYNKLKDLKWDFDGNGRAEILAIAMNAGLIRMRGHGAYWTFEFTAPTSTALWSCLSFLNDFAGPYTTCRFNNLRTHEQTAMSYQEFKAHMTEDEPEKVLRLATALPRTDRTKHFGSELLVAKSIRPNDRFVNTILYLIENLFESRMYRDGDPQAFLANILRRDVSYTISREEWEAEGAEFERSGGMPLEGFIVTFKTDAESGVGPAGKPLPVIFQGHVGVSKEQPAWPHFTFYVNGRLRKMDALPQFDMSSPQFHWLQAVVRHELVHVYDREALKDLTDVEEDIPDDAYFNMPAEVRAWTTNLIDELHQFLRSQKAPLGNQLLNSFLRESRVWALLTQHLNAQNRRVVLHELSREFEAQKGPSHAIAASQVGDGDQPRR